MGKFIHLHNHSKYSILDAIPSIDALIAKAKEYNMPAIALTDHGNMHGIMEFVQTAKKNDIKPIIGCEMYVANGSRHQKEKTDDKPSYFHLILLVKNKEGYQNLIKLSSLSYIEGFYKKPRIDKELLKKYNSGLIALSACLAGEPQYYITTNQIEKAKEVILEYRDIFGDDYYLEVQRHKDIEEEEKVVKYFKEFSKELGIGLVATNDIHFIDKNDSLIQEIMFAISDKKTLLDEDRRKYHTEEIYFKSQEEMIELFSDIPEAISNTVEIANQCNFSEVTRDVLVPTFKIPEGFEQNDQGYSYLKHLVYEGLKKRYGEPIPEHIIERAEYELKTIKEMGFIGYFLIVQDLINSSRANGVPVGPGRGSAAGSLVAYAIGITNIDPIRYNLLFERFLNPERVSMPDIDIDFADVGREKVIEYTKQKYGEKSVAQIVTFSFLKEKSAIRDAARVLNIPLDEVDTIIKSIDKLEKEDKDKYKELTKVGKLISYVIEHDKKLEKFKGRADLLRLEEYAHKLMGAIRQTGVHAAGVIIAPDEISNYVPLCTVKGQIATQYDKNYIETAGLLKMDFLGLRTLTQIYKTVELIKQHKNIDIDPEKIPLDDKKTWELFGKGETIAVFQFESEGMRKYLRELKPTCIEDIIAMNALYRPGPMDNIPSFIRRKKGIEKVTYEHPLLEPILKETYGIIVYQEQVMQIGQVMGGFSLGKADILRRAMAKKKEKEMKKLGEEFIEGAKQKNIPVDVAERVFKLMEKFAAYGFNKSHAAAYSWIAYQTAYLKANYPEEFMAAILSTEKNNADKVRFFVEEAKRMGIKIIPPNVNYSFIDFTIGKGKIYFGLSAIKNVGEKDIESIIKEREENGKFTTIFDLAKRTNINKKVLEMLIRSGATKDLEGTREQQLAALESAIDYAQKCKRQKEANLTSLFGEETEIIETPKLPENVSPIPEKEIIKDEYELIGFFATINPLDKFKEDLEFLTDLKFDKEYIKNFANKEGERLYKKEYIIGGVITDINIKKTKSKNNEYAILKLEDYHGAINVMLWSNLYESLKDKISLFDVVFMGIKIKNSNMNATTEDDDEVKLDFEAINVYDINTLWNKVTTINLYTNKTNFSDFKNYLENLIQLNNPKGKTNINVIYNNNDYSLNFSLMVNPTTLLKINLANTTTNKKLKKILNNMSFEIEKN